MKEGYRCFNNIIEIFWRRDGIEMLIIFILNIYIFEFDEENYDVTKKEVQQLYNLEQKFGGIIKKKNCSV